MVNELELLSCFHPMLIYPAPTPLSYLLPFCFIFPRRTYLGSLAEKVEATLTREGKERCLFSCQVVIF